MTTNNSDLEKLESFYRVLIILADRYEAKIFHTTDDDGIHIQIGECEKVAGYINFTK